MAQIAKWAGHVFTVKPGEIRSFENMQVKASCVTEDKVIDNEQYAARKSSGAFVISMTVVMDSRTAAYPSGVKSAAMALCADIYNSTEGFFYMGSAKLFTPMLMGVKATVQNIEMTNRGEWMRCKVALEMKQSTKLDGTLKPKKRPKKKVVPDTDGADGQAAADAAGKDAATTIRTIVAGHSSDKIVYAFDTEGGR